MSDVLRISANGMCDLCVLFDPVGSGTIFCNNMIFHNVIKQYFEYTGSTCGKSASGLTYICTELLIF